jgi:Tfp pilus assembly protein PilZ
VTTGTRKFERFPTNLRCWLRARGRTVYVRLRDISRGGVGLRTSTNFSRGDHAELVLEQTRPPATMHARAEVVWSHPDPENPDHAGTGLRFVEIVEGESLLPPPTSPPQE